VETADNPPRIAAVTTRRLALAGLYGPLLFALLVVILTAIEWDFLHSIN
jgi:hypothetical protein